MKSGRGIFTDKSRMVTESIWKDEQASGNTKIKDAEGKVHFEGTIVDGMRTGFCSFWDKQNKYQYTGEFAKNLFNGRGTKTFENGFKYEGEFIAGIEQGFGTVIFIDDRKYIGDFDKGKPHGLGYLVTDKGIKKSVQYSQGKLVQ